MKKIPISRTKYIKIDTIGKEVDIFIEYPCYKKKATFPLSLIKLLTEVDKHVLLENFVTFHDISKSSSTKQYYYMTGEFENLILSNENVLFSPMQIGGNGIGVGDLWGNNSRTEDISIEEWDILLTYVEKIPFHYCPKNQYKISCSSPISLYWDHENNSYFEPFKPED